jgi:dienelactone hydrolase
MNQKRLLVAVAALIVLLSLVLTGCGPTPTAEPAPQEPAAEEPPPTVPPPPPTDVPPPTEIPATEPPPPTDVPEPTAVPTLEPLPPEPQVMQIESFDGTLLDAVYYPASVNPAPVVVLFHQYNYGQEQWKAIAPWLQNRGQVAPQAALSGNPMASPVLQGAEPWFDSSWFPMIPENLNVAVVTVTLRGCTGGCMGSSASDDDWIKDGVATINHAAQLPGVDPAQAFPLGNSIGADITVDACLIISQMAGEMCKGAMPFSPGSYLGMAFQTVVPTLTEMGTPVFCYATKDDESAPTCNSIDENLEGYQKLIPSGNFHGIYAVDPQVEPPWLQPMIDFLLENITL